MLTIFSCSDECFVDCIGEDPSLYFQIVSKVDSTDLVFGDSKIYDLEDLKAFSLNANDTTKYEIMSNAIDLSGDRLLSLEFDNFNVSSIFLDYGNSDIDTIGLSFIEISSECCGTYNRINTVRQNGNVVFEFNDTNGVNLYK